jgi:hypothetical protein
MTRHTRFALLAFVAALLLGCSPPPPQDKEKAKELGRDTDQTVFDDLIQTEDKARGVENTMMQQKADTDAKIDAMTGGAQSDGAPNADADQ